MPPCSKNAGYRRPVDAVDCARAGHPVNHPMALPHAPCELLRRPRERLARDIREHHPIAPGKRELPLQRRSWLTHHRPDVLQLPVLHLDHQQARAGDAGSENPDAASTRRPARCTSTRSRLRDGIPAAARSGVRRRSSVAYNLSMKESELPSVHRGRRSTLNSVQICRSSSPSNFDVRNSIKSSWPG